MSSFKVVGLGEVLWDVFPDGKSFGGAPANFASHAAGLGADVAMVSAVGRDALGDGAVEALSERNVSVDYVARVDEATGVVNVEVDGEGKPTYEIVEGAAWDGIRWSDVLGELAGVTDAVCFGTLGQRCGVSAETIRRFVQGVGVGAFRVFDINLREPYYSDEVILDSLDIANVLKLSDEEWPLLVGLCGLSADDEEGGATSLIERFDLHTIALTRGAAGATLYQADQVSHTPGVLVEMADTVGAGDAYTASLVLGLLSGRELDVINEHATRLASFVCSQHGATPQIPSESYWR